ncbi:MAG: efflux RND transporter periplasmic adaptor subunit [Magnetococcales bacterium]|nr:efflux RND transporter periplasmic adaptor subunit [Magnetococcales bacterium]
MMRSLLLLIVLAGGGTWGWQQWSANQPATPRYQSEVLRRGDVVRRVSANGTLNPVTIVNVGTQVSGTVRTIHVDFNAKVAPGDKLLELDDSLLHAQARQSLASLKSAQAALDLARANQQRSQALLAQDYISRQEMDQSVQAYRSAVAQLELAQAQADKDQINLKNSVIRSPVSGVVIDRMVDVGQTVAASFQTPTLIRIAQDLAQMQIDANFAEADIGYIKAGQIAHFTVDAWPDRSFVGTVRQVRLNATVQQNVVTYDVVIAVDNPEQRLMPGMTAYVTLAVDQRQDVLLLPNAALRYKPVTQQEQGTTEKRSRKKDGASGIVHLLENDQPRAVSVTLGLSDQRYTEMVDGEVTPGQVVVTGERVTDQRTAGSGGGLLRMRMF